VEIHPDTADSLGIRDGDWVWIEGSQMEGRVKQKAELTLGIHPKVVHARSHWWFPERMDDPEQDFMESNINTIMSTGEPTDPISGSTVVRGCLCRISRAEG
jgi:anaerobic selenocysteine-containing dehydrogenase